LNLHCLALPADLEGVLPEPGGAPGASNGLGELPPLTQAAGALSAGGQAPQLPVLHHGAAHPVDLGIAADGLVVGIDKDHLVVLVGGVLAHPVGVQHAQALQPPANLEKERERTTLSRVLNWSD
jgi:hypothetical protein